MTGDRFPVHRHGYADPQGRYILRDFRAARCTSCRVAMPMPSNLQTKMGGGDFAAVATAMGRNPPPNSALEREMSVFGLPITVILDPKGHEIARLQGEAHCDSESAKAIIGGMIGGAGG